MYKHICLFFKENESVTVWLQEGKDSLWAPEAQDYIQSRRLCLCSEYFSVCLCTWMQSYGYDTYVEARGQPQVSVLRHLPPFIRETISQWPRALSSRPASLQGPSCLYLPSCHYWESMCILLHPTFYMGSEDPHSRCLVCMGSTF